MLLIIHAPVDDGKTSIRKLRFYKLNVLIWWKYFYFYKLQLSIM